MRVVAYLFGWLAIGTLVFAIVIGVQNLVAGQELESVMGVVTQVQDGDTIVLDNGTKVDLMGVEAPKDEASRKWLEVYVLDRRVTFRHLHRIGLGHARGVPVLWERTDVCGLMLHGGHCQLALRGDEPEIAVARWRGCQQRAVQLKVGMWARTAAKVVLPPYRQRTVVVSPSWSTPGL